ncbi:MAG: hypothetical protein AAF801_13775 [Pseudomonadota bacterium]
MTLTDPYIPKITIPLKSLRAPLALIVIYGLLQVFNPDNLLASNLILAVLVYMSFHWWRGISDVALNVFEQGAYHRLFVGLGIAFFALGSITFCLLYASDIIVQRFFTVGPVFLGLFWLGCRNIREVVTSRALWRWWKLSKYGSFAAVINGTSHIIRAGLNEIFIATDIELLWVLSCAILPVAIRWCCDTVIVRGLVVRGAVYRRTTPQKS